MTDPIQPSWGPPFDPNAGGGGPPDPDTGKDLSNLVPNLQVAWSTPPSFNLDPPEETPPGGGGPPPSSSVPSVNPIRAALPSMRGVEQQMLAAAGNAVNDYEALRSQVMALKDTVFGQEATVTTTKTGPGGYNGNGVDLGSEQDPSPIQDAARQFAAEINPIQEKALFQLANAIEVIGQYIAAVNRAGQTYGQADRKSVFPDPPPGIG